ncbi:MAG: amidase [Deltaproteobacteria bacterium]|jgi:amidase|nr:amidase [Deltaproteobacteria bacterium]MBT6501445.1 amidase [Deltaproteobacteria bacterium]MBT7151054.1 amidase [Deltaproteobacteria bacterium]MBT7713696.1 amidase [Deltaproteobacteria bacterium]MBT7889597.1 amidase [Deltaproteobacteria bacterium]
MGTLFSEYSNYDGLGLAELVKKGEVSPRELADTALDALERLDPKLKAITYLMADYAAKIINEGLPQGPFTGVPFLVKDLISSIAGYPTNCGSRLYQGWTRDFNSEMINRFNRAGLVTIGRTNTPENGISASCEPVANGPSHNPWNLDHITGGSSGGSAAAVAAGIVPVAHGGDGGGSIRMPSACCGTFGMKPTRGRNPLGPDNFELWHGMIVEGAITRTVRDSAAMLDCTAGPDVGAPYWAEPPERPFLEEVGRDPGKLRVAFSAEAPTGVPVHEENKLAVTEAAKLMENLGHQVEEAAPVWDVAAWDEAFMAILMSNECMFLQDGAEMFKRTPGRENLESVNLFLLEQGKDIKAVDLLRSLVVKNRVTRQIAQFFETYDIFISPVLAAPPLKIGILSTDMDDIEEMMGNLLSYMPFTGMFNLTGQPAMSVPLHWTPDGLPVGVQFAAKYANESLLYRLAGQLEKAKPWIDKRPPLYV